MSVTALRNQRERNRKTARPRFWEDDEVRAVRRIESKIFEKRFERLSPVFSKTNFDHSFLVFYPFNIFHFLLVFKF